MWVKREHDIPRRPGSPQALVVSAWILSIVGRGYASECR